MKEDSGFFTFAPLQSYTGFYHFAPGAVCVKVKKLQHIEFDWRQLMPTAQLSLTPQIQLKVYTLLQGSLSLD